MYKIISFVTLTLIAHQIYTVVNYISLRREDQNLPPIIKSKLGEYICSTLLFLPMIGEALYTYTLGFVDHLRTKRLCDKLVKKDDEIERLNKEVSFLKKINHEAHETVDSLNFRISLLQKELNVAKEATDYFE